MNDFDATHHSSHAFSPEAYRTKIVDRKSLAQHVALSRQQGHPIILANGCFDVLHVGHIRYLQAAKNLGGVLVVGINADASVQRLKGPARPILPQDQRAELVAALRCVDWVVVFEEPDVRNLIALLRPDFHAKGTDYTEESVPERAEVLGYGGCVRIVGDAKEHSTCDLITLVRTKCRSSSSPQQ